MEKAGQKISSHIYKDTHKQSVNFLSGNCWSIIKNKVFQQLFGISMGIVPYKFPSLLLWE